MKKFLFFVAIAAISLASCSNDETIASNSSGEISFRALNNKMTRAADITSASDLKSFNVYAFQYNTTSSAYINNVTFTGPDTYVSAAKYYWPSYNLDFYAWSAHSAANGDRSEDVTPSAYNVYEVTAAASAANQADFIYASSTNVAKPGDGIVTALAFAHKESRIVLKVKNTSANLSFAVTGWKIVYPDKTGTVTFTGTTPAWSANTDQSVSNVFTSAFSSTTIGANTTTAAEITGSQAMILIPQSITKPTAYTGVTSTNISGPYLAVEYIATNTTTSETVQAQTWGCWPIPTVTWEAGKQYTYTLDLADGGYTETNADEDTGLDPIFGGKEIKFSSVTVSAWDTTPGETDVTM